MSGRLGKSVVTFGLALLGGLAGAVLCWLATGFVADAILGANGMSNMEGSRAMLAFMGVGPIGALVGLFLGIGIVLRYRGGVSFGRLATYAGLVAASIAAVTGAVVGVIYLSDDVLVRNGPPPVAKFEIRLPAGVSVPDNFQGLTVGLNTEKNTMPAILDGDVRTEDGRKIIAGSVDLYFRAQSRILVLSMSGQPDRLFVLTLAANPKASAEFGPWQRVDYIDDQSGQDPRKASPGDDYEIRYRVERQD